jgi:hypothetical protein
MGAGSLFWHAKPCGEELVQVGAILICSTSRPGAERSSKGARLERYGPLPVDRKPSATARDILGFHPFSRGLIAGRSSESTSIGQRPGSPFNKPSSHAVSSLTVGRGHPPHAGRSLATFPPGGRYQGRSAHWPWGLVGPEVVDSQGGRRIESARLPPLLGVLRWACLGEKREGEVRAEPRSRW